MTLDTYSHVAPRLHEATAVRFSDLVIPERERQAVAEVGWQGVRKTGIGGVARGQIYAQNRGK